VRIGAIESWLGENQRDGNGASGEDA